MKDVLVLQKTQAGGANLFARKTLQSPVQPKRLKIKRVKLTLETLILNLMSP